MRNDDIQFGESGTISQEILLRVKVINLTCLVFKYYDKDKTK